MFTADAFACIGKEITGRTKLIRQSTNIRLNETQFSEVPTTTTVDSSNLLNWYDDIWKVVYDGNMHNYFL